MRSNNIEYPEEVKKIAIAFAKRLMSTEVVFKRTGRVESGYECSVEYPHEVPPEYSLMYGELVRNGDKMFCEFMIDYLKTESNEK